MNIIDPNLKLAPNFTFKEMTTTNYRSLLEINMYEAMGFLGALYGTAMMLQKIRDYYSKPIIVHSGFRGKKLNSRIGGSRTSQHMKGEAADFHVHGEDLTNVFNWIWKDSDIMFGQLILEGWAMGHPSWIHLSLGEPWRTSRNGQVLTWDNTNKYKLIGTKG